MFNGYTTVGYHRLMGIAMGLSWANIIFGTIGEDRFTQPFFGGKRVAKSDSNGFFQNISKKSQEIHSIWDLV